MKNWKGISAACAGMACVLVLTMAVPGGSDAGNAVSVDAAKAGIMIPLNNYFASSMNPEDEIKEFLENGQLETPAETEPQTEAPTEPETEAPKKSPYENIAISQVKNYVNIRSEANTTSEVVGKIYNNSAATILDTVDGEGGKWYKIKSGSVEGYMKAEYFVTGEDAEKIAKKVGTVLGKTTATTLRLREQPSTASRTLSLLACGEEYIVEEEGIVNDKGEEFVKIIIDEAEDGSAGLEGYVSSKYVDVRVEFKEAISIEEEKAELERQAQLKREAEEARKKLEEEQRRKEEEAAKKTSTAATKKTTAAATTTKAPSTTKAPTTSTSAPSEDTTLLRNAIVAYAKQFVGGKYVWGGNDLNTGVDCSGFVQQVYKNFGISLPRTSRSQAVSSAGTAISAGDLLPGDLVFFADSAGVVNHVAMYIGGGQIVHAASTRLGIIISSLNYRSACKYMRFIK